MGGTKIGVAVGFRGYKAAAAEFGEAGGDGEVVMDREIRGRGARSGGYPR